MSDTELTRAGEHPVAIHLRQYGISRALVIDDAYDLPTRDAYHDAIPEFWAKVIADPALLEELRGLKPDIAADSEIDDDLLLRLWEQRDSLPRLGPTLREDLFATKLQDVRTLQRLGEGLSQVGVEPITIGSEQELPAEAVKLVFIDYHLGPGVGSDSVKASTARAKEIYRNAPSDVDKPFIVLMSSKPDADAAKDNFREASGLLGGLFGYCPKDDLQNEERLYFHLATWAIDMPTRHEIQHFVEALEAAAENARKSFVQRIRALGFEDYANIQWMSLETDGQPLGDYMLWLYKSLFAHLLHDDATVLAQQKKLDAMAFERFTPSQGAPSPELADIYSLALTEPGVEALAPHPRADGEDRHPFLRLGDVLFKNHALDVLVVINAACDLAYAPGTKRAFRENRSILLLHGRLTRHDEDHEADVFRTELFKHDGKVFRIVWDHRRLTSQDYGEVEAWLSAEGYVRKARLALPYALQVQQAFGMHLMRVGVPTRPPLFRRADVEMYCEGDDEDWLPVGEPISDGARIVRRTVNNQDEDHFVLMLDCVLKIVERLDGVIESYSARKSRLTAEIAAHVRTDAEAKRATDIARGKVKGLEGRLVKLDQLKGLSQIWAQVVRTMNLLPRSAEKAREVDSKLLWVYRDRAFSGKYSGPPIVLNIKTKETSEEPAASPPTAIVQEIAQ